MASEKGVVLPGIPAVQSKPSRGGRIARIVTLLLAGSFLAGTVFVDDVNDFYDGTRGSVHDDACPQVAPLQPSDGGLLARMHNAITDETFRNKSAELLGAAVRIDTQTFDDLGAVGEDSRWEKFGKMELWLEGAFPLVHQTFKKETVNTHGLVYTWEGSDASLKPLLLMGHQDTVPVPENTVDQWVQPPFSGLFDGTWIWGRGSCDDKGTVVGVMITLENLIRYGFSPKRTILLAFGFDEEISGIRGAGTMGPFLLERYGKDSLAMIVDEGTGYGEYMGAIFATPGVSEKGYMDARITVNTKGGHSSVPPKHTGIGILSSVISTIEDNPIPPLLTRYNPLFSTLQCFASYAPELPSSIGKTIKKARTSDKALKKVQEWVLDIPPINPVAPIGWNLMVTTQAATIVQGGVKANALPEQSWAVFNHRISVDSSREEIHDRLTKLLTPEAKKYNLTLKAFSTDAISEDELSPTAGSIILEEWLGTSVDPAPVTPPGLAWDVLSGTIKAALAISGDGSADENAKEVVVAPAFVGGGTDTKKYVALSRNIFRYAHSSLAGVYNGFHTINEGMGIDNFMGQIQFLTLLVMNVDESAL